MTHNKKYTPLIALALATATTSQAAIVSYWSFDSDFTADVGGSAYDLTAVNGATAGDAGGQFGNAATFERANSEYAVTGGNVLTANADFSYSAWYNFNVSDITGSNRYFVLETSAANGISGTEAWTASVGLRDLSGTDSVQVFTSPSNQVGETGSTASTWHNIIVTYDSSAQTITAYLDGTQFATDTQASTTAVEGLVIGGHRSGTGRNFDGQIDDVAFFDHVLTSTQISALQTQAANVAVPEPSSAALLGLGGLALILRRRK